MKKRDPSHVRLIIPLQSQRPTGMGIAAGGAERFLRDLQTGYRLPGLNRWFQWLNDSRIPGGIKMILRLLVVQVAPLFCRGKLIFASHHAPLWRTGRHSVIIHDLISIHHPGQHPNQTRFFRWLLPRIVASAETVFTISGTMRDELLEHVSLAPQRITVIPSYSPKIDSYAPSLATTTERLEAREFLFVGANFLHKNLDTAVAALGMFADEPGAFGRSAGVRLVVVGCNRKQWEVDGVPLAELEARGALEIREYATEEELEELYGRVTALLYIPSTEGMGLPPLEAMARGCPVVSSGIPVLRETCGDAAFYVEPDADNLAAFLRDMLTGELNDVIERKRELGFEKIKLFSADALRERWRKALEELK